MFCKNLGGGASGALALSINTAGECGDTFRAFSAQSRTQLLHKYGQFVMLMISKHKEPHTATVQGVTK